jgi:D-tyrosyl-tRNA(Tyr) deacylase
VLAVLQRVSRAQVRVDGRVVGAIERGYCLLACVVCGDTEDDARWLSDKVTDLRLFEDAAGRTNLALAAVGGAVLLVPQFTLAADWRKGRRPSFTAAAPAALAERLFAALGAGFTGRGVAWAQGQFGAQMELELVNAGPFTLILDSRHRPAGQSASPAGGPDSSEGPAATL